MTKHKVIQSDFEINDLGNGLFLLQYMAGVLGEEGAVIEVSKEVFDYASQYSLSLANLIKRFDLQKNRVLYTMGPKIGNYKVVDVDVDDSKHQGLGYYVTAEADGYYLSYELGRNGGGLGRLKIEEEVYLYALKDGVNTTDIFRKFNLNH